MKHIALEALTMATGDDVSKVYSLLETVLTSKLSKLT